MRVQLLRSNSIWCRCLKNKTHSEASRRECSRRDEFTRLNIDRAKIIMCTALLSISCIATRLISTMASYPTVLLRSRNSLELQKRRLFLKTILSTKVFSIKPTSLQQPIWALTKSSRSIIRGAIRSFSITLWLKILNRVATTSHAPGRWPLLAWVTTSWDLWVWENKITCTLGVTRSSPSLCCLKECESRVSFVSTKIKHQSRIVEYPCKSVL